MELCIVFQLHLQSWSNLHLKVKTPDGVDYGLSGVNFIGYALAFAVYVCVVVLLPFYYLLLSVFVFNL